MPDRSSTGRRQGPAKSVKLRSLAPADFDLLLKYDWSPLIAERDTIYIFLAQDHGRYCFAAEDASGRVLGMLVSARSAAGDSIFVFHVHVKKSCRGKGLGRLLVDRLESVARSDGVARLWLFARPEVRGFYEKLGFSEASGVPAPEVIKYVRDVKNASVMVKELAGRCD